MGLLQEFKKFALKGNMIDMAVGIVIGGAFSSVISSLVKDVITPPLGLLTEQVDFESWTITLRQEVEANGDTEAVAPVTLDIGSFVNALISFLIVAMAIFIVIKIMNRVREQFEADETTPTPTTKKCDYCKLEIPLAATRCGHCTSELTA
ncbi:large conductance mechanosensitive channel protein MscL [Roseimaritima ulvae]|uniref:Large-conductance mechanosensitive channel n=1 Tax=Roseimaritima ulvae TaxID=980254 RepID=A0A5B9QRI4_9BACT|nr:large conductance mechanosensitive channel protein MscL [Roseimaritima ulvae]QEG40290.1 Large-conductance mechanosensitive channel [Roseimaritima ulvae]